MKYAEHKRENRKQMMKRAVALALLICFVSVSLLSGAFILNQGGHEHDNHCVDSTCATCVQIRNAENTLKLFGIAAFSFFTILLSSYSTAKTYKAICIDIAALTPITARNRMNN